MVTMEWIHHYPEDFGHAVVIESSARNVATLFNALILKLATYIKRVNDPDP